VPDTKGKDKRFAFRNTEGRSSDRRRRGYEVEEVGRGRWKKFTAVTGRSSPRWVEEVERGTQYIPPGRSSFEIAEIPQALHDANAH